MARADSWSTRYEFWKSMPASSHAVFLAGVFFMFAPAGLLGDIPQMGASGPMRLAANAFFAGGISLAYVVAVRHRVHWLLLVVAVHLFLAAQFDRLLGPVGVGLTGKALQARLAADVGGAITSITVSFVLLSHLIRTEGTRYGRVHAEMALARDIHRFWCPGWLGGSAGSSFSASRRQAVRWAAISSTSSNRPADGPASWSTSRATASRPGC
jgi:hypothetical protein